MRSLLTVCLLGGLALGMLAAAAPAADAHGWGRVSYYYAPATVYYPGCVQSAYYAPVTPVYYQSAYYSPAPIYSGYQPAYYSPAPAYSGGYSAFYTPTFTPAYSSFTPTYTPVYYAAPVRVSYYGSYCW